RHRPLARRDRAPRRARRPDLLTACRSYVSARSRAQRSVEYSRSTALLRGKNTSGSDDCSVWRRTAEMRDPVAEFKAYNRPLARRNPELLRYKVARMAAGPFPFYRGTFHLFARDVLGGLTGPLPVLTGAGAELDVVGDLHSE